MSFRSSVSEPTDVFQASLLNIINSASDIAINNLFSNKRIEFYRFIICEYIHSLTTCHPLRSELVLHTLNNNQQLSFYENNIIKESKLKTEWISLLKGEENEKEKEEEEDEEEQEEIKQKDNNNNNNEIITYKSIGKNCWIYIIQNYLTQRDKIFSLPYINIFFNDLSHDSLIWRELFLNTYEINISIPHYLNSFELFLCHSCRNLQSIDFECLSKNKILWNIIWKLISKYCLTLKNIHIGLYDGVWKFEFNQLKPICNDLYLNVAKHSISNNNGEITLPITRIECAPGVMPNHIISLLKCCKNLKHFFVPLIYNDNDSRWDSFSFWNIPLSLPKTLLSFRGFDAQTPLRFVHECIINLPNIEEFHVVLYFGSAHPDFIACSYTNETLKHLSKYCKKLKSFEGYFHSTNNLLYGIELMIKQCKNLKLIGLLFHPDVNDNDINILIKNIKLSNIIKKYKPKFKRLNETPNQHVTLRVVEINLIPFSLSPIDGNNITKIPLISLTNGYNNHNNNNNNNNKSPPDLLENISSQHLKSLDEIEFTDNDDDDDDDNIGLDEKPINNNNNTNNSNNNNNDIIISDSTNESNDDISESNMTDNN